LVLTSGELERGWNRAMERERKKEVSLKEMENGHE
jgi:hypothetical protein